MIFVPQQYWLSSAEEKAEYDLHQNEAQDPGYRRFLSRLTVPLMSKLSPGATGLDFGCGPGPALSAMLEEQGYNMVQYDPFYADDPSVQNRRYDFICATEVVEHLKAPKQTFEQLFSMLKPDGWLGVMTKRVRDQEAFRNWHYIRDLTHICFYSKKTFTYLARTFNAGLEFAGDDVLLLNSQKDESMNNKPNPIRK
ncbi:MAG: class I SAM-dependent methyltransferase [candidate division KSB1 bacterium]|nr:class I SAM-dependent methyltransferase [candidate division KSB1 bacterium]